MKVPILFLFFLIFTSIILLPFSVATADEIIVDKTGVMGNYKNEVENIIKNLEMQRGVKIKIYLTKETFESKDDLQKVGKDLFLNTYNLDEVGVPNYNVLLFYASAKEKGVSKKILSYYYNENACSNLVDFLNNEFKGYISDIGQDISGKDLYDKIKKLAEFIEDNIKTYGSECVEKKQEKMSITIGNDLYLIDDTNWKNVLKLISLTTWHTIPKNIPVTEEDKIKLRKNYIHYSPSFIYHREGDNIDLESIRRYIKSQQEIKSISKIVIVYDNEISEMLLFLLTEILKPKGSDLKIVKLNISEYPKMWDNQDYDTVILSEENYKTALMATLFASYLHAPLVFSINELNDYKKVKKVYCVGNVAYENCNKKYTLEQLQKYYKEITETDKILLVNPNDIEDKSCEIFKYNRKFGMLTKAYCKDSLVAPILASIKNELIIFTDIEPLKKGVKFFEPEESTSFYVDNEMNFYFLYTDKLEKVNFEKREKKIIVDSNNFQFPLYQIPSNGKVYYIDKNSDVFKLENDNDKLKTMEAHNRFFNKIVEILKNGQENIILKDSYIILQDSYIDENENFYILYTIKNPSDLSPQYLRLIKFKGDGTLDFDQKVKIPSAEKDGIKPYIEKAKLKITNDGIYIFFLMTKAESDDPQYMVLNKTIYYHYNFSGNLKNEGVIENTFNSFDLISESSHVFVDDNLNVYIDSVFFTTIAKKKIRYAFYIIKTKSKMITLVKFPAIRTIFEDKENVYFLMKSGSIYIIKKKSINTMSDYIKENFLPDKIINSNGCYVYSLNPSLDKEKENFEKENFEKSEKVKQDINNQVDMKAVNYLTVISSPKAIPLSKYTYCSSISNDDYRVPLDVEYSNGKAVGRIFGITVSDTSAYINRDVVFSEAGYAYIPENRKKDKFDSILSLTDGSFGESQNYIPQISKTLRENGYKITCIVGSEKLENEVCKQPTKSLDWISLIEKNDVIIYDDHGNVDKLYWVGLNSNILHKININNTIAITSACSTADYYSSFEDNLFSSNFISSGGLGYYGSVSYTIVSPIEKVIISRLFGMNIDGETKTGEDYDLGNALVSALKDKDVKDFFNELKKENYEDQPNIMFFGDPTIKLALPKRVDLLATLETIKSERPYECYFDPSTGKPYYCKRKPEFGPKENLYDCYDDYSGCYCEKLTPGCYKFVKYLSGSKYSTQNKDSLSCISEDTVDMPLHVQVGDIQMEFVWKKEKGVYEDVYDNRFYLCLVECLIKDGNTGGKCLTIPKKVRATIDYFALNEWKGYER
jgi:hypothetical protein